MCTAAVPSMDPSRDLTANSSLITQYMYGVRCTNVYSAGVCVPVCTAAVPSVDPTRDPVARPLRRDQSGLMVLLQMEVSHISQQ